VATLLDYALTTVADVKETLGIASGDTSKDNLIIRKINLATEMIEGYTGRRFKLTTYTNEEYNATNTDELVLLQRPVVSIDSLDYRNSSYNTDDWSTADTQTYFFDSNAGIVEGTFSFGGHWNTVRITYTAGYSTIPSDIQEAATSLASFLVQNPNTSTTIRRKVQGPTSIEYYNSMSQSIIESLGLDDILNRYSNYPLNTI
jgi:hypothetical protein